MNQKLQVQVELLIANFFVGFWFWDPKNGIVFFKISWIRVWTPDLLHISISIEQPWQNSYTIFHVSTQVFFITKGTELQSHINYRDQINFWKNLWKFWNCPLCRNKSGPFPLLNVAVYCQSSDTEACAKKLSQILANNIDKYNFLQLH